MPVDTCLVRQGGLIDCSRRLSIVQLRIRRVLDLLIGQVARCLCPLYACVALRHLLLSHAGSSCVRQEDPDDLQVNRPLNETPPPLSGHEGTWSVWSVSPPMGLFPAFQVNPSDGGMFLLRSFFLCSSQACFNNHNVLFRNPLQSPVQPHHVISQGVIQHCKTAHGPSIAHHRIAIGSCSQTPDDAARGGADSSAWSWYKKTTVTILWPAPCGSRWSVDRGPGFSLPGPRCCHLQKSPIISLAGC